MSAPLDPGVLDGVEDEPGEGLMLERLLVGVRGRLPLADRKRRGAEDLVMVPVMSCVLLP